MIKVLLVDDHPIVHTGVKSLLQTVSGIKVIGEAYTGEEAVLLAKELVPDVIMIDLHMPGIGGLEAIRKIRRHNPDAKIIALTVSEGEPYPTRSLQAGVSGYITKKCKPDEMIQAIRLVNAGQNHITPKIAQKIAVKRYKKGEESPLDTLSEREIQIMVMITQGQKVQEISKKLHLSPKTVNSYRYRIFDKLSIDSDVELTLMAMRLGMIDVAETEVDND